MRTFQVRAASQGYKPLLAAFLLLACGNSGSMGSSYRPPTVPCSEYADGLGLDFLNKRVSVSYSGMTFGAIVGQLRSTEGAPISSIEGSASAPINLGAKDVTIKSLLQELVAARSGYLCSITNHHVVIYPDLPIFRQTVRGIDVVDMPRAFAAKRYFDRLSEASDFFRGTEVFIAGLVSAPVFTEHVSIDGDAEVIDQLGQLLGSNKGAFFVIERDKGYLVFSLGSERIERRSPRKPGDHG